MQANKEVRALTGLRGVAATFVAAYHFSHYITEPHIHVALHKGYLSVDLFFMLSGLVMGMTYSVQFRPGWNANVFCRFLWLRIARIWPLYIVATLLMFVLPPEMRSEGAVLPNLLMIQGWGFAKTINPPLWSVSTEFVAYLLFPFLLATAVRATSAGLALLAAASLLLVGSVAFVGMHNGLARMGMLDIYDPVSPLPVLRCLAGFLLGLIVWRLSRIGPVAALASSPVIGLGCAFVVASGLVTSMTDVLLYPLLPVLLLTVANDRGTVARFLGWRPIHGLGVLSFSIYALQMPFYLSVEPVIDRFSHLVPRLLAVPFYYAAIGSGLLLVSAAAHYLIERPSRTIMRSWTRRPATEVIAQ